MELSSKNSINNDKILCLYCDKAFGNDVDQEGHVERDHKTILFKGKGSRKSERITKNISSSENSPFPGCFHCNKKTLRTDDLDTLFQHLLTAHKDVYFGCKCKIRAQDKVALASHKKSCKIGGGGKSARCSDENSTDNRKTARKSQTIKSNGDSKCDNVSESEDAATTAASNNKTLPTNAIHKKSDRSKLKNSKNGSVDVRRDTKSSASSTTSSSSSSRTFEDEYTIPLTRQKFKEPQTFSRLGATQNRSASNKRTQKNSKSAAVAENRSSTTPSPTTKVLRTKSNKLLTASSTINPEPVESVPKNEPVSTEFDEDFYKNISNNIRLNLSCFVDGKNDRLQNRPVFDQISEQSAASSERKNVEPTQGAHDREIHEATDFELSTPFPALLTAEQYGFGDSNPNKNKRQITKNSWKWKWDLIKKYKYVNEGGKIVKKVKQITTGLKDLSQLDMWTQLSMRSRYEHLNGQNGTSADLDKGLRDSLSSRVIKTQNVEQLNHILDKCLLPEIDIEQLQQTVIKVEPEEKEDVSDDVEMENVDDDTEKNQPEMLSMFNLVKTNIPKSTQPMLSGEWARPRCFICVDCGLKFDLMKSLNEHKNSEHPYVVSAHYEIVGRENLEQKLYKNLFLPKKALQTNGFARSLSINSDSKSNETNEASTSSDNSSKFFVDQKEKECSKCLKMIKYSNDNDIYRHILDCIEDRVWMQAKRRSKYRRSRRKNRKTPRKSRLSVDQKKVASGPSTPSTKDTTEGENSIPSISNPPTPKSDISASSILPKTKKMESLLNEIKPTNGKSIEGMNIKNFFRVSKTTPAVAQKVVVQVLEIQPDSQKKSLRSSLRSARRPANSENGDKNGLSKNDKKQVKGPVKSDESPSEKKGQESSEKAPEIVPETAPELTTEPPAENDATSPLIQLTITTPEKNTEDLQLCSPSNVSLISPTSNSNVPKKKKKLNDCIAMLTCKIQEKLGVSFFDKPLADQESPEKKSLEPELLEKASLPSEPIDETALPSQNLEVPSHLFEEIATSSEPQANALVEPQVLLQPELLKKAPITLEPPEKAPLALEQPRLQESPEKARLQEPPIQVLLQEPPVSPFPDKSSLAFNHPEKTMQVLVEPPCFDLKKNIKESKPSTSFRMESILKAVTPSFPVQDEVIDLSVKKSLQPKESSRPAIAKPPIEVTKVEVTKVEETPDVSPINLTKADSEICETPVVPIQCEPKLEETKIEDQTKPIEHTVEVVVATSEKSLPEIESEPPTKRVAEPPPKVINEPPAEVAIESPTKDSIGSSTIASSTLKVEEPLASEVPFDPDTFKISIPKDKIPNLKEILDQYQVITVNNIKISESERRAFEEQKNRILKILNKTNSLTRKITKRKANTKRAAKRKRPLRKQAPKQNLRKVEAPKEKPEEAPIKDDVKIASSVETKIQEVIKNTNRIRCRRLSVLVDPIVNLSAFQNKRKIRLTNNSQQNGFYDLLAASEQFFCDNKTKDKPSEVEKISPAAISESESTKKLENLEDFPEPEPEEEEIAETSLLAKTRAGKSNAAKVVGKLSIDEETVAKPESQVSTIKPRAIKKLQRVAAKKIDPKPSMEKSIEEVSKLPSQLSSPAKISSPVKAVQPVMLSSPARLSRSRKQNVENVSTDVVAIEPLVKPETKAAVADAPKGKKSKLVKNNKKAVAPLEEIKVEQSVKVVKNSKVQSGAKRITPRGKKQEENLLDVSFCSDTSNENDIPLAQLVAPTVKLVKEDEVPDEPKVDVVVIEERPEPIKEDLIAQIESDDKLKSEKSVEEEKCLEKDETVESFPIFTNKTSSSIDLTVSFDPFTINEDSLFNDDLDNDPSDKINDIVNNIINSSEFQIDSDTEKSEVYQANIPDDLSQKTSNCTICKRTFRNLKVFEKHCTTSTHILKVQRKNRGIAKTKEKDETKPVSELDKSLKAPSPILDETKVFRTKGALKTFDNVLHIPVNLPNDHPKEVEMKAPVAAVQKSFEFISNDDQLQGNDDKLYYEFKMEKKPEDMTPKDKDQLFDSLFSSLEAKTQEKQIVYTPKSNFSTATPLDSEMESSSTSWDLKHDAEIEWEASTTENVPFADAIKQRYPKKFPVKINRSKDTAVSIPTKSLIMDKIFKKHRDREKQKTPQADAPNNKPGIKNSLDEIFDHLKNSAEIDDKVLTCPSPKTLLKNAGGTFSPNSHHSNDMLETASQSNNNNNNYNCKAGRASVEKSEKKFKKIPIASQLFDDSMTEFGDDVVGQRKSRRRCAIKAKTFAETWSSDEYEELHDTEDIISIINEIEKRESIKKLKQAKAELHADAVRAQVLNSLEKIASVSGSVAKRAETTPERKFAKMLENSPRDKKKLEASKSEKAKSVIKKRRLSTSKEGHKSDDETFATSTQFRPMKSGLSLKKRRMSCFVPSTPSFDDREKVKNVTKPAKEPLRMERETLKKFERVHESFEPRQKSSSVKMSDSEKSFKNHRKLSNIFGAGTVKKKAQKHRKRPRNKVKNIAYDSDSDFELNLSKKSKASALTESSSSEEEDEDEAESKAEVVVTSKPNKSQAAANASRNSDSNYMTMIKEPKLLPNDLKHVVPSTTTFKAAIPEDIIDSSQSACNRTKRHSSEKLYYWSSSSSESDQEQGDTADGDKEDSVMPHQPEQHGWIVGASHKKLVTLLAHAKIKNKIN